MKIRSQRMIAHFLAAHREGSFHAAARSTDITQTAITKSIRELESVLGAELFERSTTGVRLTQYGEVFRRRAIQIEQQNDYLERELSGLLTGQAGSLRIGAGTVWADVYLPQLLASFSQSQPGVASVVRRGAGTRFGQWLEDGEIDLGLGLEPSPETLSPDLIFEPLLTIDTVLLVHKNHPLARRRTLALDALANYPLAMYRLDSIILDRLRSMFLKQGVNLSAPTFLADSSFAVMDFVARTEHVTCLPAPVLTMAKHFGLRALPGLSGPSFLSGAVYMQAAGEHPLVRAFLESLKAFAQSDRT